MNHLLVSIIAVVYIVIGIASARRSLGWLRKINPSAANIPLVKYGLGAFEVVFWPLAVALYPSVLKSTGFGHLLPPKKVKQPKVNPLDRIANEIASLSQSIGQTLRNSQAESENLRQRIAGLEQSRRDLQANYDRIREERDTANRNWQGCQRLNEESGRQKDALNRALHQAQADNEHLTIALRNAQTPPAPVVTDTVRILDPLTHAPIAPGSPGA